MDLHSATHDQLLGLLLDYIVADLCEDDTTSALQDAIRKYETKFKLQNKSVPYNYQSIFDDMEVMRVEIADAKDQVRQLVQMLLDQRNATAMAANDFDNQLRYMAAKMSIY